MVLPEALLKFQTQLGHTRNEVKREDELSKREERKEWHVGMKCEPKLEPTKLNFEDDQVINKNQTVVTAITRSEVDLDEKQRSLPNNSVSGTVDEQLEEQRERERERERERSHKQEFIRSYGHCRTFMAC